VVASKAKILKKPIPYRRTRIGEYGEVIMDRGLISYECHLRAHAVYSFMFTTAVSPDKVADRGGFNQDELDKYYPEWKNHIIIG
jgi:hypothetical protein